MSQPPASRGYPPLPKGVPPLPPFPQLMHIKDPRRSFSAEPSEADAIVMSPDEDDTEDHHHQVKEPKKDKKPHATRRRVVQSCSECRRR